MQGIPTEFVFVCVSLCVIKRDNNPQHPETGRRVSSEKSKRKFVNMENPKRGMRVRVRVALRTDRNLWVDGERKFFFIYF